MAGKMKKGGNGNEKVDFQGCQGYLPAWSELLISRQLPVAFEEGQRLHRERERKRERGTETRPRWLPKNANAILMARGDLSC